MGKNLIFPVHGKLRRERAAAEAALFWMPQYANWLPVTGILYCGQISRFETELERTGVVSAEKMVNRMIGIKESWP